MNTQNHQDLTAGPVAKTMLRFALPMMAGNLLQQLYNIADTLIVGQVLGTDALAAVGSAYTLMTFLTSIILGLCMGSGALFSIAFGEKNEEKLKNGVFTAFVLIGGITLLLNAAVFVWIDPILHLLQTPSGVYAMMREYLWIIFTGISATFLYNFVASLLRAVGNSVIPLVFLGVAALMNIGLDLLFVLCFEAGVAGAAWATVISQFFSGIGLLLFSLRRYPALRPSRRHIRLRGLVIREMMQFSLLTCAQQSVMNFGILMVQGRVNSFGSAVMAAFAAAVKIDSFAYMPVQDFGNAFSTFIAQNFGAQKTERIRQGTKSAVWIAIGFCVFISLLVWIFARTLMMIFVPAHETEIIAIGVEYLHIEGAFYVGIGCLFLLYGLYRAIGRPGMSLVLTGISLGTRVILAYVLSAIPAIGVAGIWWSVPIGWLLADAVGFLCYRKHKNRLPGTAQTTL